MKQYQNAERTAAKKVSEKRQYKYSTTPEMQEKITKVVHRLDYKRPIHLLEDLTNKGSLDDLIERKIEDMIKIYSLPLMTTVNEIHRGINVEENKNKLVMEVEQLWRDIRL